MTNQQKIVTAILAGAVGMTALVAGANTPTPTPSIRAITSSTEKLPNHKPALESQQGGKIDVSATGR